VLQFVCDVVKDRAKRNACARLFALDGWYEMLEVISGHIKLYSSTSGNIFETAHKADTHNRTQTGREKIVINSKSKAINKQLQTNVEYLKFEVRGGYNSG